MITTLLPSLREDCKAIRSHRGCTSWSRIRNPQLGSWVNISRLLNGITAGTVVGDSGVQNIDCVLLLVLVRVEITRS
jgi:hypothetical protein